MQRRLFGLLLCAFAIAGMALLALPASSPAHAGETIWNTIFHCSRSNKSLFELVNCTYPGDQKTFTCDYYKNLWKCLSDDGVDGVDGNPPHPPSLKTDCLNADDKNEKYSNDDVKPHGWALACEKPRPYKVSDNNTSSTEVGSLPGDNQLDVASIFPTDGFTIDDLLNTNGYFNGVTEG